MVHIRPFLFACAMFKFGTTIPVHLNLKVIQYTMSITPKDNAVWGIQLFQAPLRLHVVGSGPKHFVLILLQWPVKRPMMSLNEYSEIGNYTKDSSRCSC